MSDEVKVMARVLDIRGGGKCSLGHRVGDEIEIKDRGTDMCSWALLALYPFYSVLKYGGAFPWEKDSDKAMGCCPDPHNVVVFELTRIIHRAP